VPNKKAETEKEKRIGHFKLTFLVGWGLGDKPIEK
jgi:hypothetical protein